MAEQTPQQRGTALRKEIDSLYADLRSRKALTNDGHDVTALVSKYIPPGTSFADAEKVLRAAGCKVGPHPTNPTLGGPDVAERIRLSSVAANRPLSRGLSDMGNSFQVMLIPNESGNYTTVARVSAAIIHIMS